MTNFEYSQIFLISLCIIFLYFSRFRVRKIRYSPTNWPLFGMLPGLLLNFYRIHEYVTDFLIECGGTFEFKGPWFGNLDMVFTCDPTNIHYIFSKNFSNYPKGPEFKKIFEILGDGIFNADFELWELLRRTTMSYMSHDKFYSLLERSIWEKVESGLIPVLDDFVNRGSEVDLQDIFQRFTFDSICRLVLDHDPRSLCLNLPYVPCEKAFNDITETLFLRHFSPEFIWKMQKWLKIGKEKKLIEAWKSFDEFIYPLAILNKGEKTDDYSLLQVFLKAHDENIDTCGKNSRDFLRDTALNLMFAGRDTTSTCLTWLFFLIAQNPSSETKILDEIETKLHTKEGKNWRCFTTQESRNLIYLHGALCESLRLFPPVALEHKAPIRPDILPSGNYLRKDTKVILSFYSTGRMESFWGKDCLEFKPERWISDRGGIKHEPSYKFPAFNVGPRMCLGKDMSFVQMKMVAAAIIYRYKIELVDGHQVVPRDSIILQAKHGLRVKLSRRNVSSVN